MNKKSQVQFVHRCAVLLESGISLSEALSVIIGMEKSKKNLASLAIIRENVEKGVPLSKSIVASRSKFNPALLSIISFGENSGLLAVSMRQGLLMIEKGNQIQKKLIGALIYPSFIALATVGMTLFLVMYIFPKIIPLFSSMNITLPLLTRLVRGLYEYLIQYGGWTTFGIVIFLTFFVFLFKKNQKFHTHAELYLLKVPFVGQVFKKYFMSVFCRSISTLLECGQTLPTILDQTAASSSFLIYRRVWRIAEKEVTRGMSLSTSLRSQTNLFPSLVPDMFSIGERTGSLASMSQHVSRIYEEELEDYVKQLSTSIEPILMILMGLIVGSVALSIILPIYEITNHLSK